MTAALDATGSPYPEGTASSTSWPRSASSCAASSAACRFAGAHSSRSNAGMRVERDAELTRVDAHFLEERPFRWRRPPRVAGDVALHHVEQRGGVGDGARDRAVVREHARRVRRARDATALRLQAEHAAPRRRVADRAAAVGAVRDRAHSRHERRGRAAGGAATVQVGVPRVAPGRVAGRLADVERAELRHHRLAEEHEPGGAELGDHRVVVFGHPVRAIPRCRACSRCPRCRRGP